MEGSEAGRLHPTELTFFPRFDLGLFRHEAGAVNTILQENIMLVVVYC
jgi:hypothetical protein